MDDALTILLNNTITNEDEINFIIMLYSLARFNRNEINSRLTTVNFDIVDNSTNKDLFYLVSIFFNKISNYEILY